MESSIVFEPGQRIYHYIYLAEEHKLEKRYAYVLSVYDDFIWVDEYDPHTLRFFKSPKRIKLYKKSFGKVLFRKNVYLWYTEDNEVAHRIMGVYLYKRFKDLYNDAMSCAKTLVEFRQEHMKNPPKLREKKCPSNEEED